MGNLSFIWSHVCVHLLNSRPIFIRFYLHDITTLTFHTEENISVCCELQNLVETSKSDINLRHTKIGHHQESVRSIPGLSCMILFDKPSKTLLHQKLRQEGWVKFQSPQNISEASQQNNVLLNNWSSSGLVLKREKTAKKGLKKTWNGLIQLMQLNPSLWRPWDPKFNWKDVIYKVFTLASPSYSY